MRYRKYASAVRVPRVRAQGRTDLGLVATGQRYVRAPYLSSSSQHLVCRHKVLPARTTNTRSLLLLLLILTPPTYPSLIFTSLLGPTYPILHPLLGPAEEFFIPDDFEVSHAELLSVCAKADGWRGLKGEAHSPSTAVNNCL